MEETKVFEWLKGLPNKDLSADRFREEVEVTGVYNIVDCWRTRFVALLVNTQFVNYLDLSYVKADEVVLIGRFNKVDLTKSVIGTLRIDRAEIVHLDKTGAKITEMFEPEKGKK